MNISSLEQFKDKYKIRYNPKKKQDIVVNIHDVKNTEDTDMGNEEKKSNKKVDKDEDNDKDEDEDKDEDKDNDKDKDDDNDKDEDEVSDKKPEKKHKTTIVDKSATANIDRELVLKRVREFKKPKKNSGPNLSPEIAFFSNDDKLNEKETVAQLLTQKVTLSPDEFDVLRTSNNEGRSPELFGEINTIKKSSETIMIKKPKAQKTVQIMSPVAEELTTEKPGPVKAKRAPRIKIVSKLTIKEPLIDSKAITERLPPIEKSVHRVSNFYMTNRKLAISKLQQMFEPERSEFMENREKVSCDTGNTTDFGLLPHQKIAREYLNLYTPYRGLLLYFSLGSGKSCTSIAIAEGMKTDKRIFVMTPASLKMNFFTELKKCGDPLFKKDQFWEFVSTTGHPDYTEVLSRALSLPTEQIEKQGGAWLVDIRKPSNFATLSGNDQKIIDDQLNAMIRNKYVDLNYNGLNMRKMRELTDDFSKNPFDHSVVLIDEAHNFVSRIVNKIKKKGSISYMLYDYLMKATDCRVVLLTGTPIINYPNEIGILYNILRGYIKTWIFHLNVKSSQKVTRDTLLDMLDQGGLRTYDYVEYSGNKLTITRNPYGFVNARKPGPRAKTAATKKGGKKTVTKKSIKVKPVQRRTTKKKREEPVMISVDTENLITEKNNDIDTNKLSKEIDQQANGVRVAGLDYDKLPNVYGGEGDVFNKYAGVRLDTTGNISDAEFEKTVIAILSKNNIDVMEGATETKLYKALPDDSDAFLNMFVDQDAVVIKNKRLFQRRILGLTSYYRSAQEQLLPAFVEVDEDEGEAPANSVLHVMLSEMSDYQFENYSRIRKEERDQEKNSKKNAKRAKPNAEELYTISSTYRIFSRACCNFVFPKPPGRPMPERQGEKDVSEAMLDATPARLLRDSDPYAEEGEEGGDDGDDPLVVLSKKGTNDEDEDEDKDGDKDGDKDDDEQPKTYADRIQYALQFLQDHSDEYLSSEGLRTYSPKFLQILENLKDPDNVGLHLIYSQFRTIEGVGILKIILEANGFEQLKITKQTATGETDEWTLVPPEDPEKPRFLLYTGTETPEEREILRNIYNSQWNVLPPGMTDQLKKMAPNNFMGDIVKIMMITSSGAEGINLKNTRFVHIVEPYWHMVRLEQVIGRARRICSHQDLEEKLRTVKVFLYMSTFSEEQRVGDKNKELLISDVSKLDKKTALTTDESLYEIARIKDTINQQLLKSIKESAIDCSIYATSNASENLVCYGYGKVTSNDFGSFPSLEEDQHQKDDLNIRTEKLKLTKLTISGIDYAVDRDTNIVYDLESYKRTKKTNEDLLVVGKLEKIKGRLTLVKNT